MAREYCLGTGLVGPGRREVAVSHVDGERCGEKAHGNGIPTIGDPQDAATEHGPIALAQADCAIPACRLDAISGAIGAEIERDGCLDGLAGCFASCPGAGLSTGHVAPPLRRIEVATVQHDHQPKDQRGKCAHSALMARPPDAGGGYKGIAVAASEEKCIRDAFKYGRRPVKPLQQK